MISKFADAWVMTRAIYRDRIEQALRDVPADERPNFVYVELPRWAGFWQRGERALRPYYPLWQALAVRRARQLHREINFDLAWHVTWSNAWMGSLAPLVGVSFIYGPVGGGVGAPWRLWSVLGARGVAYEALRGVARAVARYANPMARLAWARARLTLVNNVETKDWLPRRHRAKARLFQHVILDDVPESRRDRAAGPPTALFAGRLLPWKGAMLAIEALAHLPEWRLLIAGSGPDETRLRRAARRLAIADRVEFLGRLSHDAALELMRSGADVFLFPSLHEEGGWALVEAMANGLPVVCLDRGGPGAVTVGRRVIVPSNGEPGELPRALAQACRTALSIGKEDLEAGAREMRELLPEVRASRLEALLRAELSKPLRS